MSALEMKIPRSVFQAGVLTTFGKLNEQEIEDCDVSSNRLAAVLIHRYGWSAAVAQTKADEFWNKLLTRP